MELSLGRGCQLSRLREGSASWTLFFSLTFSKLHIWIENRLQRRHPWKKALPETMGYRGITATHFSVAYLYW